MRIRILLFALSALLTASVAQAQTRTWLAGSIDGDDVNPCSRTAPCRTFAKALSVTSEGGYINVIDPGGFGSVTITKSITLDGDGSHSGILQSSGNGININAPGKTVVIRNLSIEGFSLASNGIRVTAAAKVVIEHVTISGFVNNGILVVGAADVVISDTTIKNVTDQGIYVQAGRTTLNRVTTTGASIGVLAGASGIVTAHHSVSSNNETGFGAAFGAASQLNLKSCVSSNNVYGILGLSGATVRVNDSMIVNSTTTGLFNDGTGNILTFGNNQFAGNVTDGVFTGSILLK